MNNYNPNLHHRHSNRLKEYDYSQPGLYFISICVQDRKFLFGKIVEGKMILNDAGKFADNCWFDIPNHFLEVVLHEHIVMPNHVHGIIGLNQVEPRPKLVATNVGTRHVVSLHDNTGISVGTRHVVSLHDDTGISVRPSHVMAHQ